MTPSPPSCMKNVKVGEPSIEVWHGSPVVQLLPSFIINSALFHFQSVLTSAINYTVTLLKIAQDRVTVSFSLTKLRIGRLLPLGP